MKNNKLFVVIIVVAIVSIINLSNAQYGGGYVNIQLGNGAISAGYNNGGGYYSNGGYYNSGGYVGNGGYAGYNNYGYAVAPHYGVVTGPIGYLGCRPGYGYARGYDGRGYGDHDDHDNRGGGYRGNWNAYSHQWR